jgi:hypothetical protein
MLLSIPYQTLEIGRVHINQFKKDSKGRSIASLSYKDSSIDINDLTILTPALQVIDYDPVSSRLRFDIKPHKQFTTKMSTLQQYLISTFYLHRSTLLEYDYTTEEIESFFQTLLTDDIFSVFVYPTTSVHKSDGSLFKITSISPGDYIRFPVCLQGIMRIEISNKHSFRLRIQHNVPTLWKIND